MAMHCLVCKKKILSARQAVVFTYVTHGGMQTRYLCREQRFGQPGCAEDMFGVHLPDLLDRVPRPRPTTEDHVVLQFPKQSSFGLTKEGPCQ